MNKSKVAKYVLGIVAACSIGYSGYVGVKGLYAEKQRREQRLCALENKTNSLETRCTEIEQRHSGQFTKLAAALGEHDTHLYNINKQYGELAAAQKHLANDQNALKGQLSGLGNNITVLAQVTNARLTQVEKNIENGGNSIQNLQTTINNKIKLIENNLITINETLHETEQTDEQPQKGITSVAYQIGSEVQYVGFSVQQPEAMTIPAIEKVLESYSQGMQSTRKEFTKETTDGLVQRTELVFTNGHHRNMLIVEQKQGSAYVFMKMQKDDEVKALKEIIAKCQLQLSNSANEKLERLYGVAQ